uniref:Uncharacterized protein n=1 Tax=Pithovirus LCPAC104 TaxID=2506589 RepID=A0A481Z449_9VIRU|nr:MAG: hypothetical protein LCPAC104_01600 [Pithovirus LCPAC104]
MSFKKVTLDEIDVEKIEVLKPAEMSYDKDKKGTFKACFISYKYDNTNSLPLYIEYPETKLEGIKKTFEKPVVVMHFDLNNNDESRYVNILRKIHHKIAQIIHLQYRSLNPNLDVEKVLNKDIRTKAIEEKTGFNGLLYWPMNKDTAERDPGKNPMQFIKIGDKKSTFIDLNENIIPHDKIQDKRIKGVPLIHFSYVYSGAGKLSIQCKLSSMIITKVEVSDNIERQSDTLKTLREKYGQQGLILSDNSNTSNEGENLNGTMEKIESNESTIQDFLSTNN